MAYKSGKKEETRQRILEAVNRGFRRQGFEGAGVDGLAKEAGLTSGAFYAHFGSKAAAFREAVAAGLEQLQGGVDHYQKEKGDLWLSEFAKFYLDEKRSCDLAESCALQSLTPEVGRSDELARSVFQTALLKVAQSFAAGLPRVENEPDFDRVWVALSMLIGGVSLARAVKDPEIAKNIANAVCDAFASKDPETSRSTKKKG